MARTRNIKPAFFDNDILGSLQPLTRLLFIGLWCIADREGRLEDRPRKIKKTLLGYDDVNTEETDGMLQQLHDNGFIIRYSVEDNNYIQIVNFTKHQNPHMKEKDSEIPPPAGFEPNAPTMHGASTVQAPCNNEDDTRAAQREPTEKPPGIQELRFNEFWEEYPKKRAKEYARKAWMKLKPTEVLFNKIMTSVRAAKTSVDWTKDNGQFIPNPASWLNGGRWEDDLEQVSEAATVQSRRGNGKTDTMGVLGDIIAQEEGGYDV